MSPPANRRSRAPRRPRRGLPDRHFLRRRPGRRRPDPPELADHPADPTFNYDTGERYLSVPDFLPEQA